MVIDLRYQIVTTVIIFLTLGIGILIGSSMVGKQGIVTEQQKMINRLENDFDYLRQKNNRFQQKIISLQEKIEDNQQFQEELFPVVIEDIISDEAVLIIHNETELGEKAEKLNDIFELAGSKELEIQSIDSLSDKESSKKIELSSYDYLIYLGSKKEMTDNEVQEKYNDNFKEIRYLSDDILNSKQRLMKYLLKLSGNFPQAGSVEIE